MEIGQRTSGRMGCEIGAKPLFLARTSLAATVQDHDVPLPQFVAVKAILRITRCGAEIFKIKCSASGLKFVIAYSGSRSRLEPAPRPVVAHEILFCPVGISEVADGHDGARHLLDQFCSRLSP